MQSFRDAASRSLRDAVVLSWDDSKGLKSRLGAGQTRLPLMSSPRFRRWSLALAGCRKPFLGSDHLWRESQEANSSTSSHESSFSQSQRCCTKKEKDRLWNEGLGSRKNIETLHHTLWHYISTLYHLMSHCAALTKDLVCSLSSFCSTHRSTSCWRTAHQQVTPAGAPGSGGCADARLFGAHDTPSILPVLRTRHIETSQANPETQTPVLGPDVWAMHDVWWVNSPGIFHTICEKTSVSFLHVLVVPGGLGLNWHQFHLLSKFEKLQNFRTSFWREFSTDLFPIGLYLGTGESQWSVASTARAQWIVTGFVHASSHLALFKHWTFKNMFRENVFVRSWLWIQCISTNRF